MTTNYPVEIPYAYAAAFDAARKEGEASFRDKGHAAWRDDASAIAGYAAGFRDGWHGRDEDVTRLLAVLEQISHAPCECGILAHQTLGKPRPKPLGNDKVEG